MSLITIKNKVWDYIIVGTGMGGGPVGLKLAQAGYSVLFLEKGASPTAPAALKGQFAELFSTIKTSRSKTLQNSGRWSAPIYDASNGSIKKVLPFMGAGVGGSSAIYGAVLERFQKSDMAQWPLSYSELEKYYEKAEKLFQVQTAKTISNSGNEKLYSHFKKEGLNPYLLPLAISAHGKCGQCQGYLCKSNCKNDSGKICIETAIKNYGAEILVQCEVDKIQTRNQMATGVEVTCQQQKFSIEARHVIVAAGALQSPLLLQKSNLAQQSGQLGRNLMRHYVDLYALKVDVDPKNPISKEIGFNDYYVKDGLTLGTVQSFGRLPPTNVIVDEMQNDLQLSGSKILGFLFRAVKPLVSICIHWLTRKRLVMASIIEDSPQWENRVYLKEGQIIIEYKISALDQIKIKTMRKNLKVLFRPFSVLFLGSAAKNKMLAHACGTCRMGTDPETSVVDQNNKIHGLDNVYVVDSSFFPTSGGTNPALTIAANSLRVADILLQLEKSKTNNPVMNLLIEKEN